MPRIDPQQLLNCLQVLLSPNGGILSKNEVQRLANLMTKFSKKLVSKCIYVLILKNTDRQLLGAFMGEGGWNLIHVWLQDAHLNNNWALVTEVLELLLLTPVDVERLKMNNLPKLVKSLTKRDDLPGIQQLATSLVEEWLTIVKDVTKQEQHIQHQLNVADSQQQQLNELPQVPEDISQQVITMQESNDVEPMDIDETINNDANTIVSENGVDTALRLKFVRDGKKVISRVVGIRTENNVSEDSSPSTADSNSNKNEDSEETDKENSDKKQKSVPKKSSSSSSSSKPPSSSSSRDKDRSRDKSKGSGSSSSSNSSSRNSSSKGSSSRDRDRRDRDRDRHRQNGSSSSSKHRSSSSQKTSSSTSSSSGNKDKKESKEKQAERDKDTLAKLQPQTLQKLGRIPKKSEESKSSSKKDDEKDKKDVKKPSSFSVEVRKSTEEKPKTVKVYNSKMRSTGLMEEAKPPPPRSATKKTAPPPVLPATIPTKRASPIRDTIPPPEKKSRLIDPEKGIKLIPPKPKPAVLQESDIFMDALTASATSKKEPKKRKRRASVTKDSSSPPSSPSSAKQPTSPSVLKNITPANFYQDTLVTDNDDDESKDRDADESESREDADEIKDDKGMPDTPAEPDDGGDESPTTKTDENGLKGVLSYGKRKGPKRSIRWRPDADLVEVQYFELDETERVNVMKPFMDMQRIEMSGEREALRMRKLPNEDVMDTQTSWRCLIEQDIADPPAEYGSKSLEKNIQFAREKQVLQAIYFNIYRIPPTPAEPDHEVHPMVNPIIIPLDDPDHPDTDAPIQPWPDAKCSPPHISSAPQLFGNVQPPPFMQAPPNAFPPNGLPQFSPAFAPPAMLGRPQADWNMLPNGIPPNIPPPDLMQQGPPMFDGFGHQGPMPDNGVGFVPPFNNGPNAIPQLFPPNNFGNNNMRGGRTGGGGGGGGGGFRRGGPNNGPWLRMGAPNPPGWNNPNQNRGRGFCHSFKKNGFCRNRDNCPYIH